MAVPTYFECMLPFLQYLSDGNGHHMKEIEVEIGKQLHVSAADLDERFPSNPKDTKFSIRVGWARTYLAKTGLISQVKRGVYSITPRGTELLNRKPKKIDAPLLRQYPEFVEWEKKSRGPGPSPIDPITPEEIVDRSCLEIRNALMTEVLDRVRGCSPKFFERLVIELLLKMGYGGSEEDAAEHLGAPGDGGIDGTIKEDKLGLDMIYIQAKRLENTVGRPELQKFIGSLEGKGAVKGVFITTSEFSAEARDFVKYLPHKKIVLIDGDKLADLMIEYDVGVAEQRRYVIKRIDSDYFEEE